MFQSLDFFRGALPEAVVWGRLALVVGGLGLLLSVLIAVAQLRDRSALSRASDNPLQFRPPKWGPLAQCLSSFFEDPLRAAPLSPDAASEYIIGRIDSHNDITHNILRYFSYTPLLLGLMGTTLALSKLLSSSGTGTGLQEIQPQLSGVFAGTLAGIIGSLIAALGVLLVDRVSLSTANQVQDFIHAFILPTLPERRIAVRIEDAVLTTIAERAHAVAENFRGALVPVAQELESLATKCATAAESATASFSEASRAVREAGNLEAASKMFRASAHSIDSSAEQLRDATKQTAEIILHAGEVRGSLKAVLDRLEATAQGIGTAGDRVGSKLETQLVALNTEIVNIHASANALRVAVDALASELVRRAEVDAGHLEAIRIHADLTSAGFAHLNQAARTSSDDVRAVLSVVGDMHRKTSDSLVEGITPRLDQHTALLHDKLAQIANRLETTQDRSPDSSSSNVLQQVAEELRRLREQTTNLTTELGHARPVSGAGDPSRSGLFRRLFG